MLDNNYNLFNNQKVDEITSTFLNTTLLKASNIEQVIIKLINCYKLQSFCSYLSFDNISPCLGQYNYQEKKLLINIDLLIDVLSKINSNEYFIKANIFRIILHELKHILQHKMISQKDNILYKVFADEFTSISQNRELPPSEINAEIDSCLTILKNYNKLFPTYQKQALFTINNILFIYHNIQSYSTFDNYQNIYINLNTLDKVLYGFDHTYVNLNLILKQIAKN